MDETTSDRLTFVAMQLQVTAEWLDTSGVTPEDLAPVADYLTSLADHGGQIASLAVAAYENTDPEHPIRHTTHGVSVESALLHANDLLNAVIHFTSEAANEIHSISHDDTS